MSCGERITELMKSKRLTQQEVADKIGVARQSISLWQKNQTVPSGKNLEKLAAALGTTSGYLLFGKQTPVLKHSITAILLLTTLSLFMSTNLLLEPVLPVLNPFQNGSLSMMARTIGINALSFRSAI